MNETPIAIALIALIGTLAAGFFKLLDSQNKTLTKGLDKLAESGNEQAQATRQVAAATEKGNREAAQRNGHLGEQNVQITKLVKSSHEDIIENLKNVNEQHVGKQVVDNQQVKTEVVDNQVLKNK